jgi:hypothetical protein
MSVFGGLHLLKVVHFWHTLYIVVIGNVSFYSEHFLRFYRRICFRLDMGTRLKHCMVA